MKEMTLGLFQKNCNEVQLLFKLGEICLPVDQEMPRWSYLPTTCGISNQTIANFPGPVLPCESYFP